MRSSAARQVCRRRLFDHALARVHEHDREVRGTEAPVTMLRVYCMWPWRVGDDELAARRRKVAVGHVDRDALLAFGAEAVGEVGEVDLAAAGDVGGALQRLELVLHERLGIVEQTADKRGFAIVHAAARVETEDIDGQRSARSGGRRGVGG